MNGEPIVLDHIPFHADRTGLRARLGMTDSDGYSSDLEDLVARAEQVARPRAIFRVSFVDQRSDEEIVIDGVRFASRVLRVNLEPVHRIFPHVVTCGREIQEWGERVSDPLAQFWVDTIKELALRAASEYFLAHVQEEYRIGKSSHMNPGSIPDWPLPQQKPLFQLLGDVEGKIGVTLTESFLMLPTKSVSGILFPTETRFESCQLCPREVCPSRRAVYEPQLFDARYRKNQHHE